MLGGLSLVLHAVVLGQLFTGLPLLIPVKVLQIPSLIVLKWTSQGPGYYIVATLGACVTILFGTSCFEVYRLVEHSDKTDSSVEASMVAVQKTNAHLNAVLALFAMMLGVLVPRLSNKIRAHDILKANHEALMRQAEGMSAEYARVTGTAKSSEEVGPRAAPDDEVTRLNQQVTNLIDKQDVLAAEARDAAEAQRKAETSLQAMQSQAKNLEAAYDALSEENRRMQVQLAQAGVEVGSKKGE